MRIACSIVLVACSGGDRRSAPDPQPVTPPPAVVAIDAAPATAHDAAASDGPCPSPVVTVDDVFVPIVGASAVTIVDRGDRPTYTHLFVWLTGKVAPTCAEILPIGFESGRHYVLVARPVAEAGRTFVTGPSARMVDATVAIERRTAGQTTFCVRGPVTLAPEWDGAPHRVTIVGEVTGTDCGTRKP